jgi:hypothetical protein
MLFIWELRVGRLSGILTFSTNIYDRKDEKLQQTAKQSRSKRLRLRKQCRLAVQKYINFRSFICGRSGGRKSFDAAKRAGACWQVENKLTGWTGWTG